MAKTYQYCVAENWGKGFIDHVEYNKHANLWIAKVGGAVKTLSEAQTIVSAEVTKAQNAWDANNVDGESADDKNERLGTRPADITLTE